MTGLAGVPVLLVNPRVALSTAEVFAGWDGVDHGPLGDWREGRNDLEAPAIALVPQIETVLAFLGTRPGATFVRMSGSGPTCFACSTARARATTPRRAFRANGGIWRPASAKGRACARS